MRASTSSSASQIAKPIVGVEEAEALPDTVVCQAGTEPKSGRLLTAGGRVLAVTAIAREPEKSRVGAYTGLERIRFAGAEYRSDIAAGPLPVRVAPDEDSEDGGSAYAAAGVDIEAGNRAVEMMKEAVRRTYTLAVLTDVGSFVGLFSLEEVLRAEDPVLVSSTDGVGTRTMIAAAMGKHDTVGHDIVNRCIKDVLVQGARLLFFLDYIAAGTLHPERIAVIVG
ncbi:MAG: phosphoribosylglycinamide synthetase C domain-containing protein, partial [Chloroflexota bacterium]|nr:phosphoribosylglycinamide synthetase C domain-containing protein [Chloroflexota bacterium]